MAASRGRHDLDRMVNGWASQSRKTTAMGATNKLHCCYATLIGLACTFFAAVAAHSAAGSDIESLIEAGSFAEAERLLRKRIPDASAPVTDDVAIQLEVLRRMRYDFPYTEEKVLEQLRRSIPDATTETWLDGARRAICSSA